MNAFYPERNNCTNCFPIFIVSGEQVNLFVRLGMLRHALYMLKRNIVAMAMVQIPFSKHVFYVLRPYRNFYCFFMLTVRLFCQIHGLTVFPNKHMVNWRTYDGLPCVLDREKTVYLWACSADENYNLDSDEILWLFDCQV